MADSNITKQALAASLRELMEELPFEKINVAHICERCGMNRKSFYYHFKDKYDLVNWIFDTGFIELAASCTDADLSDNHWEFIERACQYFYEERAFYRKALLIKGQNSFSEHFREYIRPILKKRLICLVGYEGVDDFAIDFFADAILCAMERWMLHKECMPPAQFVAKIKMLVQNGAMAICQELEQKNEATKSIFY